MDNIKFIKVTLYNGSTGYVNVNKMAGFYEKEDEDINVRTCILLTSNNNSDWYVRETMDEIIELINGVRK